MPLPNHYKTLGVSPVATQEEIRRVYLRIAQMYHPDVAPLTEENKARITDVNAAYSVLKNPAERAKYDAQRKLLTTPCPRCDGSGQAARYKGMRQNGFEQCVACEGTGEKDGTA